MTNHSDLTYSSLFGGRELLITADTQMPIEKLNRHLIHQWLKHYGVILLRNFWITHGTFANFVSQCSSGLTLDPARKSDGSYIQKVNEGKNAVGLHCENGSAPCRPDLVWFYCAQSEGIGSPTTICDGEKLWNKLDAEAQNYFLNKKLVYRRTVPVECWQNYVRHELFQGNPEANVEFEHLHQLSTGNTKLNCNLLENDDVDMQIIVPAVSKSLFSDNLSFCNSLFGPSQYNRKPQVYFEDGSGLDIIHLNAISKKSGNVTNEISWHSGDLVIIDNTRYMHGRGQVLNSVRDIYVAMSYI